MIQNGASQGAIEARPGAGGGVAATSGTEFHAGVVRAPALRDLSALSGASRTKVAQNAITIASIAADATA